MRRSEAVRYARLSAIFAGIVFLVLLGIYEWRAMEQARSVRSAPPPVPVTVQQQSQKFSLAKANGDRTLFQVEATSATAFTTGNRNLLEDVAITMFGQRGDRNDRVHSKECEYFSDTGRMVCHGAVHVDLEAAQDARERPGKQVVRVDTSQVTFDRNTGSSESEQPVNFSFPYGDGRAVGFTYDSNHSVIQLHHDVFMNLRHAAPGKNAPAGGPPTEVTGSSLEYHSENGVVHLEGPVLLRQGPHEVSCATLSLELSSSLRARRMLASGRPTLTSNDPQGTTVLSSDAGTLDFTPSGQPAHLHAEGSVAGTRKAPDLAGEQHLSSDRLDLDFDPKTSAPHFAKVDGNVHFDTPPRKPAEGIARVTSPTLLLRFATNAAGRADLTQAESPVPAVLEYSSPKDDSILRSRRVVADYAPGSHLRQVHAHQDVEIERRLPGQPVQVTRSEEGEVDFEADRWTEARQNGNVRFEEAGPLGRHGHSERSRSVHATDMLTLAGNAELIDADTDSVAPTFNIDQRTGEARGEGVVRTTYRRVDPNSVANFAPQPAHIMADRMTANRNSSRAVYTGHARLWQGDAVIQADTLDLRQQERLLIGIGNVNARLPQVQAPEASGPGADHQSAPAPKPAPKTAAASGTGTRSLGTTAPAAAAGGTSAPAQPGEPVVWAVRAAHLTYRSADTIAELDQNAHAESRLGRIASPHMDLILAETNGVQQLSKAVCTGGATVWQLERRGTADRADYTAADGRFVLSGGNPTLYDADQGTTTGRELTFFLGDDRILVDSGNGTRTLSRHRIQ